MNVNYIGMMNNASSGIMQNCNSILRMAGSTDSNTNLKFLNDKETSFMIENQQDQVTYMVLDEMEQSQERIEKENIKRTYSLFD